MRWVVWGWLGLVLMVCLCNSAAIFWFELYSPDGMWAFLLPFIHAGVLVVSWIAGNVLFFAVRGRWAGEEGVGGADEAGGSDGSDMSDLSEASDMSGLGAPASGDDANMGLVMRRRRAPLAARLQVLFGFGFVGAFMAAGATGVVKFLPPWLFILSFVAATFVLPMLLYFAIGRCIYLFGGREKGQAFTRREAVRIAADRRRRARAPRGWFRSREEMRARRARTMRPSDERMAAVVTLVAGSFLVTLIVWVFNLAVIYFKGGFSK